MVQAAEYDSSATSPIRVFLIDGEAVVRAGMRLLIDSWQNCEVVGEADAAPQAIAVLDAVKPDLILLSHRHVVANYEKSTGHLEELVNLAKTSGRVPLVLLTNSRDPRLGAKAVKTGARGLVLTRDAPSELRNAIDRTVSGGVWVSKSAFRGRTPANGDERRNESDQDRLLTKREREVATLVSGGCTDRQVSLRLGITEITVRHHLSSIFNKLGIGNRFELIVWAYRRKVRPQEFSDT
jgi:DNA-binding NarL/FixJ family response regulator